MLEKTIQNYLMEHIPISKALGVEVEQASSDQIIISAPFANNINHKMTVFGGSLQAVATLACWSLLYSNLIDRKDKVELVISHSDIDYLLPVKSDFKAICAKPDDQTWNSFIKILNRKGKARISLEAQIFQSNALAVKYTGVFVALKK